MDNKGRTVVTVVILLLTICFVAEKVRNWSALKRIMFAQIKRIILNEVLRYRPHHSTAPTNPPKPIFLQQRIRLAKPEKWNLTICTTLYNSLPFTFEWIEFHRLQGVDHFVIYDDGSDDKISLLPEFYAQHDLPSLVEVHKMSSIVNITDHSLTQHEKRQLQSMQHCLTNYRNRTEWMFNNDVDEFAYAVNSSSLWSFLETLSATEQNTTEYRISAVRFGTSDLKDDNFTDLVRDPESGKLHLLYNIPGVPLISDLCPHRAPHPQLDENYKEAYDLICGKEDEARCDHAMGKNIFRPQACSKGPIHYCATLLFGTSTAPPLSQLRIDHFPFRSAAYVAKRIAGYDSNKLYVFEKFDQIWFSLVPDESRSRFHALVRSALNSYKVE